MKPEEVKDFQSISFCNVVYKVVSKCLVNRLRPLLHDLISPNQSAFILGHLITDNTLIAFECIHTMKQNKRSCDNLCAYKLDLLKTYDRVDWSFLKRMLEELGFHHRWI